MADSLDDFFAKKDKKRGKGKTVLTAEALVKELEEGSRQVEHTNRNENKPSAAIELLGLDADDADWKDFEDIEKKDYSGLKIKELSLQEINEEELRRLQAEQAESREESSVWKTTKESSTSKEEAVKGPPSEETTGEVEQKTESKPSEKVEASADAESKSAPVSAPTVKSPYRPPQARNKTTTTSLEPSRLPRRNHTRPGQVPDLENKMDFPGLG